MHPRRMWLHLCNVVYWLGLIVWIAALAGAGIAAMHVFPTLDRTPLSLAECADYPTAEHPRLLAIQIMEGVFFLTTIASLTAAPFVLLTLLLQLTIFGMRPLRPANLLRALCLVIGALLFAYHAAVIYPSMNRELRAYWNAVQAGSVEQAHRHRDAFNTYHPLAGSVLRFDLLLVTVAAAISAVALGPTAAPRDASLEPPRLLRER